jgi:hypothetical protein
MYQLMHQEVARAHMQVLRDQLGQDMKAARVARLARARRLEARAKAASERAHRKVVALSA